MYTILDWFYAPYLLSLELYTYFIIRISYNIGNSCDLLQKHVMQAMCLTTNPANRRYQTHGGQATTTTAENLLVN